MEMAESSFRDYFAAAGAQEGLTDREKTFIGLAVTMSRGCEPCSYGRIQRALESGMSREDLDAAINLIAAVNAGVVQAIARRGHEHIEKTCPSCSVASQSP
jgi:alkylhydroperoxidase/carboxymuconolactone decarboxylase family protein YurZ